MYSPLSNSWEANRVRPTSSIMRYISAPQLVFEASLSRFFAASDHLTRRLLLADPFSSVLKSSLVISSVPVGLGVLLLPEPNTWPD